MKTQLFAVLAAFFVLSTHAVRAQGLEFPEDKSKWKFSVEMGKDNEATVIAEVSIVKEWHINAIVLPKGSFGYATKYVVNKSKDYKLVGAVMEPKPVFKHDEEADEDLYYHEGKVKFKQKIKILTDKEFSVTGSYSFQPCDATHCLAPYDGTFSVKVKPNSDGTATVEETTPDEAAAPAANLGNDTPEANPDVKTTISQEKGPVKKEPTNKLLKESLWTIFILSFISGLAALMTPCVFPMIPMTVSFFTKRSKSRAEGIKNAMIYSFSIIIIYIVLGSVVTAVFGAEALNNMSTNPWFNLIFFILLVVFAVSFLGAFEIRLPSSWVNKVDAASDRGGIVGIFFMALALALVSFSCTGPIVGDLIVISAKEGGIAPVVGMFGFSFALALPFGLFAAFPGWMNTLPKSGGWLNTVKVVLGLLELALAFKFLSNADLAVQAHYLERELFLAIWIAIFLVLALYLFGFISFPHDSPIERISVGRGMLGMTVLAFVIYMLPGLWGAPLNLISAFPPPPNYAESPLGIGGGNAKANSGETAHVDGMHLGPQNIMVFHDYDKAKAYADKHNKPLFVDFTGHNCVNCRKMEQSVWGQPGIIDMLKNDVVIASLHIDERVELPKEEQKIVEIRPGEKKKLLTTGDKWFAKEIIEFQSASQPLYVMIDKNGKALPNGKADYDNHRNPDAFKNWLKQGIEAYNDK